MTQAAAGTQTYANHARFVPLFHFVAGPILFVNFLWWCVRLLTGPSWQALMNVLVAVALALLFLYARQFAVTAQDRIIRLEMRLRMKKLLPPDLQARIGEFTVDQLVALRFAGDEELPALARTVLDEKLADRKTIKQMIRSWQGDYLRV